MECELGVFEAQGLVSGKGINDKYIKENPNKIYNLIVCVRNVGDISIFIAEVFFMENKQKISFKEINIVDNSKLTPINPSKAKVAEGEVIQFAIPFSCFSDSYKNVAKNVCKIMRSNKIYIRSTFGKIFNCKLPSGFQCLLDKK